MWQDVEHTKGNLWSTDTLIARHEANIERKAKETSKEGGVKERPFFEKVLHSNIIFSVLHAMMGIGNDGVDHVMDYIEFYIEEIPQKEVNTYTNAKSCRSTSCTR